MAYLGTGTPNNISNSLLGVNPPGNLYYQNAGFGNVATGGLNARTPMSFSVTSSNPAPALATESRSLRHTSLQPRKDWRTNLSANHALQIPQTNGHKEAGVMATDNRFVALQNQQPSMSCGLNSAAPRGRLGCNVVSSGEDEQARRTLRLNSDTGVKHPTKVAAKTTQGWRAVGKAPLYSTFDDSLYNTQSPTHLHERKMMTGIFVNTNTGKMYKTYEEDIPPPNTNASMEPSQLQRVNPKLVALQGGIDFNRPPRQKTEIQQNMPGVEHGPNMWGDQLFAGRRREREMEIASADVWGNKGGMYSTEPIQDGRPTGYVGFQNMVRINPYAQPTQRGRTDVKYSGPVQKTDDYQAEKVVPHTTIRKPDLTPCNRQAMPGAINGVDSEWFIPTQEVPGTDRGVDEVHLNMGAFGGEKGGHTVAAVEELRPHLKEVMVIGHPGAAGKDTGSYIHMDNDLQDSLKEALMAQSFMGMGGIVPDVHLTDNVGMHASRDGNDPQRDAYGGDAPTGVASSNTPTPHVRVYKLDLPDTMRAAVDGITRQGAVFAVEDNTTGKWAFAFESDLPSTVRATLEGKTSGFAHTNFQGQDGWMLPNFSEIAPTLKDFTAERHRAGIFSPGDLNPASRVSGGDDLQCTVRGDADTGSRVLPTKVANDGHDSSPFDGFCMSAARKPPREQLSVMMPAQSPHSLAAPGRAPARVIPRTTCKKNNEGGRVAALNTRPTYFTETQATG